MNQCPDALMQFIHGNLSSATIASIAVQLQKSCVPDRQVLWTGMTREAAQKWADAHDLQTLTTAMGAYMNTKNQLCPQKQKSHAAWIDYIHGASALFALRISQGEVVTVLSNPPPQRFHPDGNTSFQCIEAPIITGELGNRAVTRNEIALRMLPKLLISGIKFGRKTLFALGSTNMVNDLQPCLGEKSKEGSLYSHPIRQQQPIGHSPTTRAAAIAVCIPAWNVGAGGFLIRWRSASRSYRESTTA
ncbi:hypothetical protein BB8028_0006g11060 [Beauveria bassiana]|uniref:Uncharacterized protein n=1 Tax=Beauveria bassiana TaxID=176275 RepID=A0A2S7YL24_BEABA|nr:hypothetical protein BB8028_0006g11060 [Beauveria bassiana]